MPDVKIYGGNPFRYRVPSIVFVLALLVGGLLGLRLLEAYWLLGCLSPVLDLLTLAILLFGEEAAPSRVSRRRVTRLAGLAVVAPLWLIVMYFLVAAFHR